MEAICCEMSWLQSCLLLRLQGSVSSRELQPPNNTRPGERSVVRGPGSCFVRALIVTAAHTHLLVPCELRATVPVRTSVRVHLSSSGLRFLPSLSECGQGSFLFIRLVRVIAYGIKVSFEPRSVWEVSQGR